MRSVRLLAGLLLLPFLLNACAHDERAEHAEMQGPPMLAAEAVAESSGAAQPLPARLVAVQGDELPGPPTLATLTYQGPGVPDGTNVSPILVGELLRWVENESGYHPPAQPKVIASKDKFIAVLRAKRARFSDARAMYIPGMVILDNNTWDERDMTQISLLVHDLVHHAQLYSNKKYACNAAKEFEAYTLQNKWLQQHGESFFASDAWIERLSSCPEQELHEADADGEVNAARSPLPARD